MSDKKTQHDKIVELCSDGEWHCQRDFRALFIWSPHKRRDDLKKRGYAFEERKCTHGIRNSKDYRLRSIPIKERFEYQFDPVRGVMVEVRIPANQQTI